MKKQKNKISKSKIGVSIPHNEEWNVKIGESNSKPTAQCDKDGKIVAIFKSRTEAELITGIRHQDIAKCISGKGKTAGGFVWKDIDVGQLPRT